MRHLPGCGLCFCTCTWSRLWSCWSFTAAFVLWCDRRLWGRGWCLRWSWLEKSWQKQVFKPLINYISISSEMKKKSLTQKTAGNPVSDQRTQHILRKKKIHTHMQQMWNIPSPELAVLIIENMILVNLTKNDLAVEKNHYLFSHNLESIH